LDDLRQYIALQETRLRKQEFEGSQNYAATLNVIQLIVTPMETGKK
jgi:hypothetical protein